MALRLSVTVFLLLVMCTACGSTRMVRLDTGDGRVVLHQPRGGEAPRVELEEVSLPRFRGHLLDADTGLEADGRGSG